MYLVVGGRVSPVGDIVLFRPPADRSATAVTPPTSMTKAPNEPA